MTTGGRFVPGATGTNTSSRHSGDPVQHAVSSITSALGGLANSLTGGLKNAAGTPSGSTSGSH